MRNHNEVVTWIQVDFRSKGGRVVLASRGQGIYLYKSLKSYDSLTAFNLEDIDEDCSIFITNKHFKAIEEWAITDDNELTLKRWGKYKLNLTRRQTDFNDRGSIVWKYENIEKGSLSYIETDRVFEHEVLRNSSGNNFKGLRSMERVY